MRSMIPARRTAPGAEPGACMVHRLPCMLHVRSMYTRMEVCVWTRAARNSPKALLVLCERCLALVQFGGVFLGHDPWSRLTSTERRLFRLVSS